MTFLAETVFDVCTIQKSAQQLQMTDTGLTASLLSNMGMSRRGGLVYDIILCEVTIDCYSKQ